MRIRIKKRYLLLAIMAVVGLLFLKADWLAKWMYPIHYQADIRASASNYGVEPHLVAAIIRAESNYSTGRQSSKGALGLMQLMPNTANWVVERAGFQAVDEEILLHRADVSIEVGTWYLKSLYDQFDGNAIAAVAAYNAGPGHVRKWLDAGTWDGQMKTVKSVPFGETRHYVQRVFYYYNKYKDLYPNF